MPKRRTHVKAPRRCNMFYATYEAMNGKIEKQSRISLLTAGGIGIWEMVFEGLKPMRLFALSMSFVDESEIKCYQRRLLE